MSEDEEEIGDIILKEIVCSDSEWHEAEEFAAIYGVEKPRMQAILENWAKSKIVEWGVRVGRKCSVRLRYP